MASYSNGHLKTEKELVCPYNSAHWILQSRFATHLIKCRPTSNLEKCKCPYNSTHIFEQADMGRHMELCPDRKIMDTFKYTVGSSGKTDLLPVENRDIPSEENWDDDADHPTYNPETKLQEDGKLLVNLKNAPPSERKKFREHRHQLYSNEQDVKSEVAEAGVDGELRPVFSSHSEPFESGTMDEECGAEEFDQNPMTNHELSGVGRGSRVKKTSYNNKPY